MIPLQPDCLNRCLYDRHDAQLESPLVVLHQKLQMLHVCMYKRRPENAADGSADLMEGWDAVEDFDAEDETKHIDQ